MIVVCSSEWFLVKNGTFRMLRLASLFGRKTILVSSAHDTSFVGR